MPALRALGSSALGLVAGMALVSATALGQEEQGEPEPPPRAPEFPAAPRGAAPTGRGTGLALALIPLRGADSLPSTLAAGDWSIAFPLPGAPAWAVELRVPFLLHPAAVGSPMVGLYWTFLERATETRSALQATLRIFAPAAPSEDVGAFFLARARPFLGADWERSLTVAPGLVYRFASQRYALLAEVSLQAATTDAIAAQVALAYLLGIEVRLPVDLRVGAEVAGRAFAHGGLLDERSLVGLALGLRRPFGPVTPAVGVRWALAEPRGGRQLVVELGAEARW